MNTKTKAIKDIEQKFDVIISGGGLSGALTALSLSTMTKADGGLLSIAIIEEKAIQENIATTFDDRVLALSHGTAQYLAKVGAWQFLQKDATAIEKIHISDQNHYGKARLNAKNHGVDALGYVVEMALIGKSLLKALSDKKNIHWFSPDSITKIDWQQNSVSVQLTSKKILQASLLLACDGVNSPCRKFANIHLTKSDYQQVALIANVATELPHNNKAFERFTKTGPIAMLPLSERDGKSRCSLVWTLTPERANEVMELNDDDFKQALNQTFGFWLGEIKTVGKRDVYPLVLVQAKQQVYHRMALVGNASHTIHPIAGQGFNLGVRDVAQLALLIENTLQCDDKAKHDIGSFTLLNRYEQQRKKDHQQVIMLTDSLVTLFSNDITPLVIGRNVGLKVLNYCSPFKNALVKKTMGY